MVELVGAQKRKPGLKLTLVLVRPESTASIVSSLFSLASTILMLSPFVLSLLSYITPFLPPLVFTTTIVAPLS